MMMMMMMMMVNLGLSKDGDCGRSAMKSSLLTGEFLHDDVRHSVGHADNIMSLCNGSTDISSVMPRLQSVHTVTTWSASSNTQCFKFSLVLWHGDSVVRAMDLRLDSWML